MSSSSGSYLVAFKKKKKHCCMADAWKRRSRRPLKKTRAERRRVCERGVADRSIERESYGQQCERLAHFCAVGVCITGALAHRGLYARVSPFAFFLILLLAPASSRGSAAQQDTYKCLGWSVQGPYGFCCGTACVSLLELISASSRSTRLSFAVARRVVV
jgi:hypothetical protein